jgi:3-phosphoshikimate 1-carboxyvinyltransferase
MGFFADVLQKLNVSLSDFEANIPFTIQGPLCAKNITVDGSLSSQFISGLLFAFAQAATEKVILKVEGLVSKPYIDLSLEVLALFGKKIKHQHYQIFEIDPRLFSSQKTISLSVESDWSSAAFWVAAATIKGSVSLLGLNRNSNQADKIILEIAERVGAKIKWDENVLQVSSGNLNAFETDLNDAPDLFPILSVLAACCDGQSKISGLHRLIHKESNRAESITQLLSQLGVPFVIEQDTLIIQGTKSFNAIEYHCPNDHRMAMAAALASLRCDGAINILNAECVQKSYPDFWKDLCDKSPLKVNFL